MERYTIQIETRPIGPMFTAKILIDAAIIREGNLDRVDEVVVNEFVTAYDKDLVDFLRQYGVYQEEVLYALQEMEERDHNYGIFEPFKGFVGSRFEGKLN